MSQRLKILIGLVIFAAFAFLSYTNSKAAASPEDFVFVGWEAEPFYYRDSAHGIQGALHDIMAEVCRIENLQCRFKIVPFRDSVEMLKRGEAQAGGPFVYTFPRATVLSFSDRIFSSSYAFFALPKNAAKIKVFEDLRGLSVGVMSPSVSKVSLETISEFVDGKITIVPEKSISSILRKLENKTYPVGYANRDAALQWIRRQQSPLKEIPDLGEKLEYRIAFSQKGLDEALRGRIYATLGLLRKNGFLTRVAQRYKLTLSEGPK